MTQAPDVVERRLEEISLSASPLSRFAEVIEPEEVARLESLAGQVTDALAGRTIWSINSTALGGGVAEILEGLLPYARGVGLDARWLVIEGTPEFFRITKRIHNRFHGAAGDGGELGEPERAVYEAVLAANASDLEALLRPGDVAVLHDPQTAGLAPRLAARGVQVIWRCHIPIDLTDERSASAWAFLAPYLEAAAGLVFSHASYVPTARIGEPGPTVAVIPPSLDPFSPKNQALGEDAVRAILAHTGLVGPNGSAGAAVPAFRRRDGSPGRVDRCADIVRAGPPPPFAAPLVVQVSRWDRLKDMQGVLEGFAHHLDGHARDVDTQLLLVGPNVSGVADDPEGAEVLNECIAAWRDLPHADRTHIGLACLPMQDGDENATIVNALQRHATVVVQKSLAEGFGLTAAEAMWKARPVLASGVGGLAEQIVDGESGVLLPDPADLGRFGELLFGLLSEPDRAKRLGDAARERVRSQFLLPRHLSQWAELVVTVRGS